MAFEPYRSPVKIAEIQSCVGKAVLLQQLHGSEYVTVEQLQPRVWIVTPTLSEEKQDLFCAKTDEENWGKGIYLMGKGFQVGIIVAHQLPVTPETLLFRLMEKGQVQLQAMAEVEALPADSPYREGLLELLASYRIDLASQVNVESDEEEILMQLSPLYLETVEAIRQEARQEGEARGQMMGQQVLVVRLLDRQVGKISDEMTAAIKSLSTTQLESLGEALLDFEAINDLQKWLQQNL